MITGPKPKTHCVNGHELTTENSYQTYKNGVKNGRACRQCNRDLQADYRKRKPEVMYRSRANNQLRKRYGIQSLEERDAILAAQGGACKICGRTDCTWGNGWLNVWHVDHDHSKPGTYRSIVCGRCNILIGIIETAKELIDKVVTYLGENNARTT